MGSGVPGGTHPNLKNMGSVVPGSGKIMGSVVPGGTHENPPYLGSIGFRVPSRTIKSGFQWVPGSRSEPKKWVPVGSGFRVGTQKVGSGGFRVPTKFCFVPTPGSNSLISKKITPNSLFSFYQYVYGKVLAMNILSPPHLVDLRGAQKRVH